MSDHPNSFPKLHNAAWPGVVGKEPGTDQPPIDLDTMLDLTAAAEVDGVKFDGVDLFLFDPHINIDISDDELKEWADKFHSRNLVVGTVVAPIWGPTGGGSAMDEGEGRDKFLTQVRKGCRIAKTLRELGVRSYGNVRFDSACGVGDWLADPDGSQVKIAETFRQACDIAADFGEKMVAEGEICWGGMHSWKRMVQLLEMATHLQEISGYPICHQVRLFLSSMFILTKNILPTIYNTKMQFTIQFFSQNLVSSYQSNLRKILKYHEFRGF